MTFVCYLSFEPNTICVADSSLESTIMPNSPMARELKKPTEKLKPESIFVLSLATCFVLLPISKSLITPTLSVR